MSQHAKDCFVKSSDISYFPPRTYREQPNILRNFALPPVNDLMYRCCIQAVKAIDKYCGRIYWCDSTAHFQRFQANWRPCWRPVKNSLCHSPSVGVYTHVRTWDRLKCLPWEFRDFFQKIIDFFPVFVYNGQFQVLLCMNTLFGLGQGQAAGSCLCSWREGRDSLTTSAIFSFSGITRIRVVHGKWKRHESGTVHSVKWLRCELEAWFNPGQSKWCFSSLKIPECFWGPLGVMFNEYRDV